MKSPFVGYENCGTSRPIYDRSSRGIVGVNRNSGTLVKAVHKQRVQAETHLNTDMGSQSIEASILV